MFYNKSYNATDYFNYTNYNELKNKVLQLVDIFSNISNIDNTIITHITPNKDRTNFLSVQDINYLEEIINKISFDFFRPTGYILNKKWIEDETKPTRKSINYIDVNRMIQDMNLLYDYKDDTRSIYNLYTHEEWNTGVTSLVWRE